MVQTTQIGRKLAKKRALKARMERAAFLPPEPKRMTGKEYIELMEAEGVFGAWANRADIGDSAASVRQLRGPVPSIAVNARVLPMRPEPGALADLMAQWRAEDETDDEEELNRRDVELEEFKASMNGNRAATGERPVY